MNLIHIRQQIDAIDSGILQLLAKRSTLVRQTPVHKTAVHDADREREVQRRWAEEAERLGLSVDFAKGLIDRILDESRRIQTDIA
jgi:chorismate mutase